MTETFSIRSNSRVESISDTFSAPKRRFYTELSDFWQKYENMDFRFFWKKREVQVCKNIFDTPTFLHKA